MPTVTLRTTKEKTENQDIIPFVLTHNPRHTDMYLIARSNLPLIKESRKLKDLVTNTNLMRSRQQPPNCKKC